MAYSNKEVFTLSSISVIVTECIFNLVSIFIDTFLIARILTFTGYNLYYLGLFYAITFFVMMVFAILLNYTLKYIKLNYYLSLGAIFIMATVLVVYFLSETQLLEYMPLLAFCYGFGNAAFYVGHNNLSTYAVRSRYQIRFFSVKKSSVILIKTIVPLVLGTSITTMGFNVVAIIMAVFTLFLLVFSLLIKPDRKYQIKFKYFSYIKKIIKDKQKYKLLWHNYISGFLYGCSITELTMLFTYFVIKSFDGSNLYLGLAKTAMMVLAFINTLIFLKFYRKRRAKFFTMLPLIIVPIAGVIMTLLMNSYTILIFYTLYNIFVVIIESLTDMRRAGIIRLLSMHDDVIEHNAVYYSTQCLSRTIFFVLIMLAGLFDSQVFLIVLLFVFFANFVLMCINTYYTEKLLIEQDKTWHIENKIENK